jgi:hypothetical protein
MTCCHSLAGCGDGEDESPRGVETAGSGGTAGSVSGAGEAGTWAFEPPVLTFGGAPPVEPEEEWCEVAERYGATFCESGKPSTLEYCEPAPEGRQGCIEYERPPEWVYELVVQCYAHCGVGIRASERVLQGSCCYTASSEYYGR